MKQLRGRTKRAMLLFLFFSFSCTQAEAQEILNFGYTIVKTADSVATEDYRIDIPVYRVIILGDSIEKEEYENFTSTQWQKLISQEETSYRACLLLYAIHNRDAEIFLAVNEDEWFYVRREEELAYWTEVLAN